VAIRAGMQDGAPVMMGSHIDSVLNSTIGVSVT